MLIIARKRGERIELDGGITIIVMAIEGTSRVKLGIEAPDDVQIRRVPGWQAKEDRND